MNLCDSARVPDVINTTYLFTYVGGSSSVLVSAVPLSSTACEESLASSVQTSSTPPNEASASTSVSVEAGGSSSVHLSTVPTISATCEVSSASSVQTASSEGSATTTATTTAVSAEAGGSSPVQVSTTDSMNSVSQTVHVSPYDLAPLPSVEAQVAKRKRRGTTSTVLTSSPYMSEMKVAAERKRKANSSVSKTLFKEVKKCASNDKVKQPKVRPGKKHTKKDRSKPKKTSDEEFCKLCGFGYGDSSDPKLNEDWLVCVACKKWFHDTCAQGYGIIDDDELFTCGDCFH